jgi:hypothetical protein
MRSSSGRADCAARSHRLTPEDIRYDYPDSLTLPRVSAGVAFSGQACVAWTGFAGVRADLLAIRSTARAVLKVALSVASAT